MRRWLLVPFALLALGNPTVNAAGGESTISYGCDEVVAIGRVTTAKYTDLTAKEDALGHGRYDMKLAIKRVVRGNEKRRVVPIVGFSHAEMRNDADFWMILTPTTGGAYLIRSANLTRIPYKLARTCGEGLDG